MEVSSEFTKAIKKVAVSNQDFLDAKGEKVKQTAFDEHLDACLDALAVTSGGDFGEFGLFDFSTSDDKNEAHTRIVIAGLGSTDNDDRRILVSVKDLKQDKQSPSLLYIEYSQTDEGNKNTDWTINAESLPKDQNSNELFVNALSTAVSASSQQYLEHLSRT